MKLFIKTGKRCNMLRNMIKIDEDACTGCGECITNCPEGAIQLIDGKARLISEPLCDGLGACIGHCPENAITVEQSNSEPYDEITVIRQLINQGEKVVHAHLCHLKEHGQEEYYRQAVEVLKENNISIPDFETEKAVHAGMPSGCPGARSFSLSSVESAKEPEDKNNGERKINSALTHWPIQLHLISPTAPYFRKSDLLLSADCVAHSLGDFHSRYLSGKTLCIACPKLDEGQEVYKQKITALIDESEINTITVLTMQVPCCRGLLMLTQQAREEAKRNVPIKNMVISVEGKLIGEEWT